MAPKKETKPVVAGAEVAVDAKMAAPDKAEYNKKIETINAEIENLSKSKKSAEKRLQEKSSDKDDFFEKKSILASKLKTYSEQAKALSIQRQELIEEMRAKNTEQKNQTAARKNAEKDVVYHSEEQLTSRIKDIEFEMCTGSLSLMEEKKRVAEIQQLKKMKPKIAAQQKQLESLRATEKDLKETNVGKTIREQIDIVTAKRTDIAKIRDEVYEEKKTLIEGHKKDAETTELESIKKDAQEKMNTLVRERNDLRKKLQDEEYAYQNYQAEQRRLANEKRSAAAKAKREEYEKIDLQRQMENLNVQPHLAEVALLEQTITFCKSLLPKEHNEEAENVIPNFNNPEGSTVLVKKQDRDEEFYMLPSKKKGPHKKNKAPSSNVIKHAAYSFRLFDAIKIAAPSTTDQLPATLEKLNAELARYTAEVAKWEQKRDDGTLLIEFQAKAEEKRNKKSVKAAETAEEVVAVEA